MARQTYDDLIFQLGDLAREHLAESPLAPPSMQEVFDREDDLVAAREGLKAAEEGLNQEDEDYRAFKEELAAEKVRCQAQAKRWHVAVMGVDGRSRDLKKKLSTARATLRYQKLAMGTAEAKHADLELREGHDFKKVGLSAENLKKLRLQLMRLQRNIEEMDYDLKAVLTPSPGQQGAAGILAHKRILEMDDELEQRKFDHEQRMKELDAAAGQAEEDIKAAEEALDGALYQLGQDVHAERINHPALVALYGPLDKAR
jgi:hypothetical protein